ncbi:urea transporter 2 isoform X1 [Scophthalmus maximus]|uniref:urea transporter 2 isoform X1 n=1 Tax=Scophthalmus maximus TaxID=52904 RepID=UPI0015E127D8|nr:urea transporter 2 isoform X1 [Scophthalmus maximus]XP_035481646.1 urea transporter 2 isoform X1 [Scophthalmus maximus]XP_035481647.1 urea transporter 2 isoform X1 [Scophthalmus maximus]
MLRESKPEVEEASRSRASLSRAVWDALLLCTGDMEHLDDYVQDKSFVLQLAVWGLRGVARVTLANNPLTGALILAALYWASPWQGLLGTLGALASTLTAVIMGQDSAEVSGGHHGCNGMLVSLLMGVFSSAGDWYWRLLLPVCLGSATCVFVSSGLSSVLARWDLPVSVFPFNIIIILYLLCVGPDNLDFPHQPALPPGALAPNSTKVVAVEVMRGIPLGVGQIFACAALGPSLLILGAVALYSPLLAAHALLGSAVGSLAGLSMAVHHHSLYSGLSGFNGALGCMSVGGLFFTFNWRTHLLAITSAFLSAYADIALGNLLGTVGLPACSWAATLTATLMLLLTGSLAAYRIPTGQVMAPEHNLHACSQRAAGNTTERERTVV